MSKPLSESLRTLFNQLPHRGLKRGELQIICAPSPIGGNNPSRILSELLGKQAKLEKTNNK